MRPMVSISGLSANANDRIIAVEVRDEEGRQSDSVDITLDDRDQAIGLPSEGQTISVSIGYVETGLVFMGSYKIDSVKASAPPYEIKVSAKSIDLLKKGKHKQYKAYENKKLGEIIQDQAKIIGAQAVISPGLANELVEYIAMQDESALHFVTRLADMYDANANVKDGRLVFTERGTLTSGSGLSLGTVTVLGPNGGGITGFGMLPGNVIDFDCDIVTRPQVKQGVKKGWDKDKAEEWRESVLSLIGPEAEQTARYQTAERARAKREAQGKARSLKRNKGQLSLTVVGDPTIRAESPLLVQGLRAGVDGMWRVKSATHTFSGGAAYVTKIEAEKPNSGGSSSGGAGGGSGGGSSGGMSGATSGPLSLLDE
jgi:hypothetical protein